MDAMTARARALAIIAASRGCDAGKLTDATTFADDLGADELDLIELVMTLEQAFGIDIDDATIERFVTVGDVLAFIGGAAS
jgi:acyl carrier protein